MNDLKKECEHLGEPIIGYMIMNGIERKVMRCLDCKQILDYYPQYNSDI